MKLAVFSYRTDETEYFNKFVKQYNVDAVFTREAPTLENVEFAKGCDCISIITTKIDSELLEKLKELGVKFISTRTIGYDHIDIDYAHKIGIGVGNVTYSPNSVAEYTVMLILMANRKAKHILERSIGQDYSLKGIQGKEIRKQTIGIIGTGRIGETVIKNLSGFGPKIIAYDLYEKESIKELATYVSMDQLLRESDVITMHTPLTPQNYHLINEENIAKMKTGVVVINTARGALIDTPAFIDAIESKKIGAAALDVIENETEVFYNDFKYTPIKNRELAILKSFPNVTIMPHVAFYTDQAVSDMVENSIISCIENCNASI